MREILDLQSARVRAAAPEISAFSVALCGSTASFFPGLCAKPAD
jgi:hypothetical protein